MGNNAGPGTQGYEVNKRIAESQLPWMVQRLEEYLVRRNERTGEDWRVYKSVHLSPGLYFRAQIINRHQRMIAIYFNSGRWMQGSKSRILEDE